LFVLSVLLVLFRRDVAPIHEENFYQHTKTHYPRIGQYFAFFATAEQMMLS